MNPWEHNEGRPPSMADVNEILSRVLPPTAENPPVLAIDAQSIMRAKNNGYPKHLYHESLDPVVALNKFQESELYKLGYVTHYIPRQYPKTLFRRNMDPKYDLRRDPATGEPLNHDHIEERIVRTKEKEAELRKQRQPEGCSPWVDSLGAIEPLIISTEEDARDTILRLEGQLEEARRKVEKPEKKEKVA